MSETYLYVIKCEDNYKIGITRDPSHRLKSFTTGNPYKMSLMHSIKFEFRDIASSAEKLIHEKLSDYHVQLEWFNCDYELIIDACYSAAEFSKKLYKLRGVDVKSKAIHLIGLISMPVLSDLSGITITRMNEIRKNDEITREEALRIVKSIRALT